MKRNVSATFIFLLLLIFVFSSVVAMAVPIKIHPKWKERALIAQKKIEQIMAKNDGSVECKYNCDLERAFACYADPKSCTTLIKQSNGTDIYKLAINCTSSGVTGNEIIVEYIYNSKTGKLITHKVQKIPQNWILMAYLSNARIFAILDSDGNGYAIDLDEPTSSYVAMTK